MAVDVRKETTIHLYSGPLADPNGNIPRYCEQVHVVPEGNIPAIYTVAGAHQVRVLARGARLVNEFLGPGNYYSNGSNHHRARENMKKLEPGWTYVKLGYNPLRYPDFLRAVIAASGSSNGRG